MEADSSVCRRQTGSCQVCSSNNGQPENASSALLVMCALDLPSHALFRTRAKTGHDVGSFEFPPQRGRNWNWQSDLSRVRLFMFAMLLLSIILMIYFSIEYIRYLLL